MMLSVSFLGFMRSISEYSFGNICFCQIYVASTCYFKSFAWEKIGMNGSTETSATPEASPAANTVKLPSYLHFHILNIWEFYVACEFRTLSLTFKSK